MRPACWIRPNRLRKLANDFGGCLKKDQDITVEFPGVFAIHQKVQGREVGEHQHVEHEIFLPIQGEIEIEALGKIMKAGPGKLIYLPPELPHIFRSNDKHQGERMILIIQPKTWSANGGGNFGALSASVSQLSKEILFHLLIHPETKAAQALIQTLIQTTSEMLENAAQAPIGNLAHLGAASTDKRLKTALTKIAESFNESISMTSLAREAGLSLRNLNRIFVTEIGMTPKQVITNYRIEKAKKLLTGGALSVTDVSLEVGYSSLSQFIATFRKATGQLPSFFLPRSAG